MKLLLEHDYRLTGKELIKLKRKKILCVCVWVRSLLRPYFVSNYKKTESSKYRKVLPLCPYVYMSNQNAVK